ncbi:NmrA family protein [Halobacteriales archaeon SW_7_71_33]|nr:MAG: NmrA family protein [Halobacteriales archaeon SW_7_71_33]
MRVTVFGATGRTGRPLVEQAVERDHEVVAFARSPGDVEPRDGVTVVEGDAYTGTGVSEAVADSDAVVSVLGQTGDGPDDLLTVAGDHVLGAMTEHGVDRFHVERVRATDLDWTVVRAPRLVDGKGTGDYRAGDVALGLESVARADVACFILDCLEGDLYVHAMPKVGSA